MRSGLARTGEEGVDGINALPSPSPQQSKTIDEIYEILWELDENNWFFTRNLGSANEFCEKIVKNCQNLSLCENITSVLEFLFLKICDFGFYLDFVIF